MDPLDSDAEANDGKTGKNSNQNGEDQEKLVLAKSEDSIGPSSPGGPEIAK